MFVSDLKNQVDKKSRQGKSGQEFCIDIKMCSGVNGKEEM